jgi:hypothetical protein
MDSAQYNLSDVYSIQSSSDSGLIYSQTDSNSSSCSPPEAVPKLYVDIESSHFSSTGPHHHDSRVYARIPSTESHQPTPTTGSYSSFNDRDMLELHAAKYHESGYTDRAVDMSVVTSSLENTLRAPKLYPQYS